MPNAPSQPPDPPTEGASPAANPAGKSPHGIPDAQVEHDATADPTDDRHDSETGPLKS